MHAGAIILLAAFAITAPAVTSQPPVSSAVERALTQWLNIVSAARTRAVPKLSSNVERELYRRGLLDQASRVGLAQVTGALAPMDRSAANAAIQPRLLAIDRDNLAYVKAVLPNDDWFRRSRDGEIAATRAWLIVHHSDDWSFKREVLRRMAPLLTSGEIQPSNYALLYDRIAMHDGKPQRFGSQFDCRDGRTRLYTVESRDGLDERRASVGLEPIAVYLREGEGQPC